MSLKIEIPDFNDYDENTIKHTADDLRLKLYRNRFNEQTRFIWREGGDFLKRLMDYNRRLNHIKPVPAENNLKEKIKMYNDEYSKNCCRVCNYYVFSSGCKYCGSSRQEQEFFIHCEKYTKKNNNIMVINTYLDL